MRPSFRMPAIWSNFFCAPKKHSLHLALHCSAVLYTEQWGRAPAADSCHTVRRGKWRITWTQRRILYIIPSVLIEIQDKIKQDIKNRIAGISYILRSLEMVFAGFPGQFVGHEINNSRTTLLHWLPATYKSSQRIARVLLRKIHFYNCTNYYFFSQYENILPLDPRVVAGWYKAVIRGCVQRWSWELRSLPYFCWPKMGKCTTFDVSRGSIYRNASSLQQIVQRDQRYLSNLKYPKRPLSSVLPPHDGLEYYRCHTGPDTSPVSWQWRNISNGAAVTDTNRSWWTPLKLCES